MGSQLRPRNMKEINQSEAEKKYKIFTRHQEMENGELRFRLIKDDGTAYSRTEAGGSGFWQESHCHKNTKETYIVQKGWIACAKMHSEQCKIQIFKEDEIFTIGPDTCHNIYMAKGAVIHTVKHGESKKEDRILNNETKKLDKISRSLNEDQILALAEKDKNENSATEIYSKEYRHFDDLIWQVPTWCTAIFTATITGGIVFISLGDDLKDTIAKILNIQNNNIFIQRHYVLFYYFVFMFVVLFIFSYALLRFRMHQRPLGKCANIPFYKSSQLYLQLTTCFEFCVLLLFVLLIAGISFLISGFVCAVVLVICMLFAECNLRRKKNHIKIVDC